jgi:hypothetical protein
MTIGEAVGISIAAYVRHEKTRYDELLAMGEDRTKARKVAEPKLKELLGRWSAASAQNGPPPSDSTASPDLDEARTI